MTSPNDAPLCVLFACYGDFNCNSSGHIAGFANALSKLGHRVGMLASGDPDAVREFGQPLFECFSPDSRDDHAPRIARFLDAPNRLLHAWTPRERLRRMTEALSVNTSTPFVIHLEDNETHLLQAHAGIRVEDLADKSLYEIDSIIPGNLSHPIRYKEFLERAAGVTIITESLSRFVPVGLPMQLLEPGVDSNTFKDLPAAERKRQRQKLGIKDSTTVVFYHGNMHFANRREIFSLYVAILLLQRRGHDVRLIRCGHDYCPDYDVSQSYVRGRFSSELGRVDRDTIIRMLKLADIFVQPGSIDEFNAYRFPSKIPEFLAQGQPVVLPRTNIGLRLKDGIEAVTMDVGDGTDIANKIQLLLQAPKRAARIGRAGREFAQREFDWEKQAQVLEAFYRSLLMRTRPSSPKVSREFAFSA